MMGRQSRQMAMVFVDMASLIPENHLLRKIDGMVSFDFIYGLLAPYYSATGRPSVDPVSMFKMLLVGYLYGIKSERRLVEEIRLNIAYRWFCGFELDDAIPDHSTFSKTRTRKWQQSGLFQNAFYEIVKQCIACGLIDGKAMAADGSYIPANVSRESWVDVETEVEQSMQSYLDALDEELSQQPGFKKPPERTIKKRRTTSRTDPDSGYINHGNKRGIGYLMEATVDCKHGILTGVDVYPANEKESLLVLRHLEQQIKLGVPMNQLALDRGYDTGAVHRGLELLGVTGYIPAIQFPNAPEKYGFSYNPQRDAFICPEGVGLTYHRLNCNQSTGKYLRCYQIEDDACKHCVKRPSCFDKAGIRRRVLASSCYPAFFRGHQRVGTPEFLSMMRLRKIWAEGSFSVLKREHCISKIRKRGILAATEECLLAAMALNLKRMASAVFFYLHISYSAGTTAGFGSFLAFVNGSGYIQKMVVADRLALLADTVYAQGGALGGWATATATVLFCFELYCDFSSYTDIARGAARILGVELMENFRSPFLSQSVAEFWRNWHISLSSFFRDYLYIPLGGSRRGLARTCVNTMVVFLCSGLWHGAAWTFVAWGLLHGLYLVCGRLTLPLRKRLYTALRVPYGCLPARLWRTAWTFALVAFSMIFFRAGGMDAALSMVRSLLRPGAFPGREAVLAWGMDGPDLLLSAVCVAAVVLCDVLRRRWGSLSARLLQKPLAVQWAVLLAGVLTVAIFGMYGEGYVEKPFIYFQF